MFSNPPLTARRSITGEPLAELRVAEQEQRWKQGGRP